MSLSSDGTIFLKLNFIFEVKNSTRSILAVIGRLKMRLGLTSIFFILVRIGARLLAILTGVREGKENCWSSNTLGRTCGDEREVKKNAANNFMEPGMGVNQLKIVVFQNINYMIQLSQPQLNSNLNPT